VREAVEMPHDTFAPATGGERALHSRLQGEFWKPKARETGGGLLPTHSLHPRR
jgi:hypothetical protein